MQQFSIIKSVTDADETKAFIAPETNSEFLLFFNILCFFCLFEQYL